MQRNYFKLLEVMHDQSKLIDKQSEFIDGLMNENIEKENMINILFEDVEF